MNQDTAKIIYTQTDEAPALATYSLLPIIQAFTQAAGVKVETRDISLAGRIIARFPENLTPAQQQEDALEELGLLAKTADANIIKLPNISASIPQLAEAIKELQDQGYDLPDYPENPHNEDDEHIKTRYAKILGSAVNPVLREGNSDRRVAAPVKQYAKQHPHSMGEWNKNSKSHVAHMTTGDFYGSEQSVVVKKADSVKIQFVGADGSITVLKTTTALQKNEVIDSSVMSCSALRDFFEQEMVAAKDNDVMLSLHLKATMMKVSDPVMFGHAVTVYYKEVFTKHAAIFAELGVDASNGLGDVYAKIVDLPAEQKAEIEADIEAVYLTRPALAMVNSDKGITNLHVPNDVIVDASMPAAIRASGKMWGTDGGLHDTKAMIPDRCYAKVFQEAISFCKENGAFDVATMGSVSNVGLMAQKAEEYGSHNKTFIIEGKGQVQVVNTQGNVLMQHDVEQGDIWRMCQTKDAPIKDWVKLAVKRAKATKCPTIFWLDPERAHDTNLISIVKTYLADFDISALDIQIMSPVDASRYTLQRVSEGLDTVSVTGNVLRDYLTDLFPILELGTSAKMLSIVPLLAGGGLYETGAGGSAPKHAEQLAEEGHLRWDSLGEFLALAVSLEDLGHKTSNDKALILSETLTIATGHFLDHDKSPLRKSGELDNRGSHFYLTLYWAQALADQDKNQALKVFFSDIAEKLCDKRSDIVDEFAAAQGSPIDLGGYYHPDAEKMEKAMRPSPTFNAVIEALL
jgi:isocitrate dehydrogenase